MNKLGNTAHCSGAKYFVSESWEMVTFEMTKKWLWRRNSWKHTSEQYHTNEGGGWGVKEKAVERVSVRRSRSSLAKKGNWICQILEGFTDRVAAEKTDILPKKKKKKSQTFVTYVCIQGQVRSDTHQSTSFMVRGQLVEVNSLLPHVNPEYQTQVFRFCRKLLWLVDPFLQPQDIWF